MNDTALLYRVPNSVKRSCPSRKFNLQPEAGDLLNTRCMYGIDQNLAEITAALAGRIKEIEVLRRHLGEGAHWVGI